MLRLDHATLGLDQTVRRSRLQRVPPNQALQPTGTRARTGLRPVPTRATRG